MIETISFWQFTLACWAINLSLNGLYVLGRLVPAFVNYDYPLDFKKLWPTDKRRILGQSTTIPGLAVAIVAGIVTAKVFVFSIYLGLLLGVLVYAGHALGSFIKRRFGYLDGQYMPLVDHGNYMLSSGAVLCILGHIQPKIALLATILTYLVHPVATYLGYKLKLHKYPR